MVSHTLRKLGMISESQLDYIRYCRSNDIKFANATKRIPLSDDSVNAIYSSHMLEHLSRRDSQRFFKEALRILEPKGIVRIAIPDLAHFVDSYASHKDADRFMRDLVVEAPTIDSWVGKFSLLVAGYRHHQWMYDKQSVKKLIESHGFINITVLEAGETCIKRPGDLDLYERSDQSLYVEAEKA